MNSTNKDLQKGKHKKVTPFAQVIPETSKEIDEQKYLWKY
jgi:hypothetical protein